MDFSKLNLNDNIVLAKKIVLESIDKKILNRDQFFKKRNAIVKKNKGKIFDNVYLIKAYFELLKEGKIKPNPTFFKFLQKRGVRTMSGVAPVTVLMKPFSCPGKCIYCPTDTRMPKSYIPSQPAGQRAFRQRFNPYTQVFARLKALNITGHTVSKVELRIIGGTFNFYPKNYQTWFIGRCIQAMNEFPKQNKKEKNFFRKRKLVSSYGTDTVTSIIVKSISKKKLNFKKIEKKNEKAEVRCIGVNIETRPDFINEKEIIRMRELGITKVELGVQTVFDEIFKKINRGHLIDSVIKTTALLKDAGFKIGYHMMPNLPSSTPSMDKEMIKKLFESEDFQPDYLKIYPCVVMPNTPLFNMYKKGDYKPYDDKTLGDVLYSNLLAIPYWCRVDRVARDIPSNEISAGFKISNIRQLLEQKIIKDGKTCKDIRFREIKDEKPEKVELLIRSYKASKGIEYFLSYEDKKNDKLIALLRLRLPFKPFLKELKDCAIVREIHVYGIEIAVGEHSKNEKQHIGYGTELMNKAEELVRKGFRVKGLGYRIKKIAVIAGIGTREYYRKKGYKREGMYMVKELS